MTISLNQIPSDEDILDHFKDFKITFVEPNRKAYIDRKAKELIRMHYNFENVLNDAIKCGDIVTLSLSSELKKYNKDNVELNVGKNYYNKDIESQLIGMKKGEKHELNTENKSVIFEVLEIKRRIYPEYNDAFIREHFDAYENVQSYEESIYSAFRIDELNKYLMKEVVPAIDNYLMEKVLESVEIEKENAFIEDQLIKSSVLAALRNISTKEWQMYLMQDVKQDLGLSEDILELDDQSFKDMFVKSLRLKFRKSRVRRAFELSRGLSMSFDVYDSRLTSIAQMNKMSVDDIKDLVSFEMFEILFSNVYKSEYIKLAQAIYNDHK